MMAHFKCARVILSLAVIIAPLSMAWALPMAPEACDRARSEQAVLSSQGVASEVAKGGDWGRANLGPDRLAQVARWIELEEQILFKCPRPPIEAKANPAAGDANSKAAADGNDKPSQDGKSARTKPDAGEAKPASTKTEKAPAVKPKPKPKPRDDAYVPPAPHSGQEIQHATPGAPDPALPWSSLAP